MTGTAEFTRRCGEAGTITGTSTANGVGQNMNGWTLEAYLSLVGGQTWPLVTKTIGHGITVTNAAGGICTVTFASADTEDFPPGSYVWALWRVDAGSEAAQRPHVAPRRE